MKPMVALLPTLVAAATAAVLNLALASQPQSPPVLTDLRLLADGEAQFNIVTSPGLAYRIDTASALPEWQGLLTLPGGGLLSARDSGAPFHPRRFYRAVELAAATVITGDHVATDQGDLVVHPINHASLVLAWHGKAIYVDPVGGASPYEGLPRADLILLTHSHGDHLHAATLTAVKAADAVLIAPPSVANSLSATLRAATTVLTNGATAQVLGLTVEAVPAYNRSAGFHAKGTGNGYVLTLGGPRVYVSGDTEDVPEMRALTGIHVAFLAMNLPYTMSVTQAVDAVRAFKPRIVYPYHYRNQDGTFADLAAFKQQVAADPSAEVRLRPWY